MALRPSQEFPCSKKPVYTKQSKGVIVIMREEVTENPAEDALADQHTPEPTEAQRRLMKLAEEQGVKPMTLETLKAMSCVWPEDESIDDFITAVQEWRSEGGERDLP
jgi:hypothetical protein